MLLTHVVISQCSMRHLYSAGDQSIIAQAKQFERRRCGHHELDEPLSAFECIRSVIDPRSAHSNKHRYVGAVQDIHLRSHLRKIPGVPLIYISRSVMIMEPMAEATEDFKLREEREKFRVGLKPGEDDRVLGKRKRNTKDQDSAGRKVPTERKAELNDTSKNVKRYIHKGPNPLSVKKPKNRETKEPTMGLDGQSHENNHLPIPRRKDHEAYTQPNSFTLNNLVKKKRKRKPSNWKGAIVDKVLAQGAKASAEIG